MPLIESFLGSAGVLLFVLGLLHCVLPHSFRQGVLLMLTGDAFFALAIAFPKKVLFLLQDWELSQELLNSEQIFAGVIFGLAVAALWYLIFIYVLRYTPFWRKKLKKGKDAQKAENTDDAQASQAGRAEAADPAIFADVKLNPGPGSRSGSMSSERS
ncbi:MAG: hypothetical protein IAB19_05475 [Proteobacteria bacterium]|uniref:Uncharacterized protein n=1 Tax=Candidatus Avisuccinivibrio stercorigallinarum TaxID=2840704 RepID=A0A9D9GU36_9GAMM|nr:hypothetical protein [Candidatus Avisuccinivibrio stercorigallinarum]